MGQLAARWTVSTPSTSPAFAIANGILYVFALDYYGNPWLYALSATGGPASVPKWMIPADQFDSGCWVAGKNTHAQLMVEGGLVYVYCGLDSDQLYVIDAASGTIISQSDVYSFGITLYHGGLYRTGWQWVAGPGWGYA